MKLKPLVVYEVLYEPRTDVHYGLSVPRWAYSMAPTLWKTKNLAEVEVLRFNHSYNSKLMTARLTPRQVFTEPLT